MKVKWWWWWWGGGGGGAHQCVMRWGQLTFDWTDLEKMMTFEQETLLHEHNIYQGV